MMGKHCCDGSSGLGTFEPPLPGMNILAEQKTMSLRISPSGSDGATVNKERRLDRCDAGMSVKPVRRSLWQMVTVTTTGQLHTDCLVLTGHASELQQTIFERTHYSIVQPHPGTAECHPGYLLHNSLIFGFHTISTSRVRAAYASCLRC